MAENVIQKLSIKLHKSITRKIMIKDKNKKKTKTLASNYIIFIIHCFYQHTNDRFVNL